MQTKHTWAMSIRIQTDSVIRGLIDEVDSDGQLWANFLTDAYIWCVTNWIGRIHIDRIDVKIIWGAKALV